MTQERQGEIYMLFHTLFESWFPIIAIFSINLIGALYSYAFTVLIAGSVFLVIVIYRGRTAEFFNKKAYRDLLLTTFYITLLFILLFLGLKYTTAGNMAVIIFLQLLFSYLYFNLFGKERLSILHTMGAFIMGTGALIILFPADFMLNKGDLIILAAAAIAPVANYYQKRAREYVSSETILAFRSLFALPFLFGIAYFAEPLPPLLQLQEALIYLFVNGVFIMGLSKIFWVEALHRMSITKTSAMVALIPLFTLLFAYFTLNEVPTLQQFIGILPIIIGGFLITRPLPEIE